MFAWVVKCLLIETQIVNWFEIFYCDSGSHDLGCSESVDYGLAISLFPISLLSAHLLLNLH